MKKKPLVFSLIRDQSLFMTAIMSLLTFLSVLTLGITLAIGTGVSRWNAQWDLFATVQVMDENNLGAAIKIINDNRDNFEFIKEVSKADMEKLLRPWVSDGANLNNYLPHMYELKFKQKSDIPDFKSKISGGARFLTHSDALRSSLDAGSAMMMISNFVLLLILSAIGICVAYIAKNTAQLHRRELEILNQVGATDKFISGQMQTIIARICTVSGAIGFALAAPILILIIGAAHGTRTGLMSMINIGIYGWSCLVLLPIIITAFSIFITKKTTIKILEKAE